MRMIPALLRRWPCLGRGLVTCCSQSLMRVTALPLMLRPSRCHLNQQPNRETLNSKVRGAVLTFRRSSGRRNRLAAADVWCLLPRPRDSGATLFCRQKRPAAHRQRRCTRRKERNWRPEPVAGWQLCWDPRGIPLFQNTSQCSHSTLWQHIKQLWHFFKKINLNTWTRHNRTHNELLKRWSWKVSRGYLGRLVRWRQWARPSESTGRPDLLCRTPEFHRRWRWPFDRRFRSCSPLPAAAGWYQPHPIDLPYLSTSKQTVKPKMSNFKTFTVEGSFFLKKNESALRRVN